MIRMIAGFLGLNGTKNDPVGQIEREVWREKVTELAKATGS